MPLPKFNGGASAKAARSSMPTDVIVSIWGRLANCCAAFALVNELPLTSAPIDISISLYCTLPMTRFR
jgi:hypothetical protein